MRRLWCWLTGQHLGRVDYSAKTGAYWMCDNCGHTVRGGHPWWGKP